MITLYNGNKTNGFNRNDLILRNATKCETTWEKNGQFQIDLVYPIIQGDTVWKQMVKGSIVKCAVPYQKEQLFRLNTPSKKIDENSGYFYIEVTGYHITYDLNDNFLEDVRPTGKSGIEAGQYILANTQYSHSFNWIGDITDVNTAYYIRKNPIDALIGDDDNSYLNRWGGELVRDNFNIGMFKQAGENRGVVIRYSKNLTGLEQSGDDSNLMTRCLPYCTINTSSTDSTDATSTDTTADEDLKPVLKLPEKYIDSPLINNYSHPYVKPVQVELTDEQQNLSNEQKYQIMRDYVNNLYSNNHVDVPVYSYAVNFVDLAKTEEYKEYAILEELHPYDFITVKALNVDVIAELVGYTYDSISKQYETITLGNVENDILRHTQKTLFQMTQNNQNNIKILQAQMEDIPGTILGVAQNTTSGGNNLFDHSVLDSTYASEWTISGRSSVISDNTLHDTDKVWELPPGASVSKEDVLLNPNNYNGQQLMFSLQAKYNGLTIINNGAYNNIQQTNVLLGALDAVIQRCLVAPTGTTWNYSSTQKTLVSEKVGVTGGTAITITNSSNYSYTIHAWDNQGNQLADFTTGTIPSNAFNIQVEILENIYPSAVTGFSIFETNNYTAQGVVSLYANSTDSDWQTFEQSFSLQTEHPSDIIKQINFRASNGDSSGTAYIAAFMINTGTVSSSFSQSSNDTVETLRAHQVIVDYISAKKADIDQLSATNATIATLSSTYATITNLNSTNGNIQNLTASVGTIMDLTTNTLKSSIIDTAQLKAGCITADSGIIGTSAVRTSQIADGSITDAKIVTLTANKLTAGTIDASKITVTNLNCANLTVGTINGQQIADGAIDISKLTDSLNSTITTASSNAQSALTAANGKNKNYYSAATPTGTFNSGDLWFDTSNGNRISQWNGSSWVLSQFGNTAVTNLDAGSITTGTFSADRIGANTITTTKIAAGAVQASNILSNTITATQIASNTITATQIASRTITADRIVTGAITANEIAGSTITGNRIASNTIVAGNIQAGTLTSASGVFGVISANNITTGTLNASLVSVTNLNAGNITTGNLSASRISGGTLTLGGGSNGNGLSITNNFAGKEIVRQDNNGLTITMQKDSTGNYLNNAFKIQDYTGTTLLNIDDAGQFIYHGVMDVQSLVNSSNGILIDPSGSISFSNNAGSIGIGTGDGASWATYNLKITSWQGLAIGSNCNNDTFAPKIMINCRTGDIDTWGHLYVAGAKNRVVKTQNYGTRALSAYETAEPYFGDFGEGKIGTDGTLVINIEPIFKETVNTSYQYQVFYTKYGAGDMYVEERNADYFVVKGTSGLEFGWELKAKQVGFEIDNRLLEIDMPQTA